MLTCFHCGNDIVWGTNKYRMVPLDTPYINLFFCPDECWIIANTPSIEVYLSENEEKVYNSIEKSNKKGRN